MILLFVRLSTPCTHAPLGFVRVYVAYYFCTRPLCMTFRNTKARKYMYIEFVLASLYDFVHHKHTSALLHPTPIRTYIRTYMHTPICFRISLPLFLLSPLSHIHALYACPLDQFASNHLYYLCVLVSHSLAIEGGGLVGVVPSTDSVVWFSCSIAVTVNFIPQRPVHPFPRGYHWDCLTLP